jgi:malonyl-CoA/methylmalonyl-CoA synthetase
MTEHPTVYASFRESVARHPDKTLVELPGGGSVSYADMLTTSFRIAARLVGAGVGPGDRVAAQVEKSPDVLALYLATLQLGAIYLPLNTAYTGAELDYFLRDAEPTVLVVDPASDAARAGAPTDGPAVETLGADGTGTLLGSDDELREVHDAQPDDPAAILYTSGTTGRSKGAVLTHRNLASNCAALLDAWEFTGEDRLIHALPLYHVHGLFVAGNMTLAAGATLLWLAKFDAGAVLDLLPRATVLMGVPTFYTRLANDDRLGPEICASMRLFVSGSAPLTTSAHERFAERTGHAILERYGMTETGMNTSNPYRGGPRKPGTVGTPIPGVEVRVVARPADGEEDDGKPGDGADRGELPRGEVGSVEVRGPNVFAGYWRMPEKTASEFRDDGFFVTGDVGHLDEDGYLCLVGRDKDMIISGGLNVYPKEIEEVLDAHADVDESAVVGVPHPDLGETPVAFVVPAAGRTVDPAALASAVAGVLARFKHPRGYEAVDELPRNVMGKVQKARLREIAADLYSADADSP